VERGDRRLDRVGPGRTGAERALDEGASLRDLRVIPQGAVLALEAHERPLGVLSGVASRIVQKHEREEPARFGAPGQELVQQPSEADRLGAQLPPDERVPERRGVTLIEDQVDGGHDAVEALVERVVRGNLVGDAGVADLGLGPHEPLHHRRLRHEEPARDLRRR
jgi:hypothetical protein